MSQQVAELSKLAFEAVAEDDLQRALELFDKAAVAPDATEGDIATALKNSGVTLGLAGESHAAIARFNEVIERFAGSPSVVIQLAVFKSLFNKALILDELGRTEEALRSLNQLLAEAPRATHPSLQPMIAEALLQKAIWIDRHGKVASKAVAAFDLLLKTFQSSLEPAVRKAVAHGWVMKGLVFEVNGESLIPDKQRRQEEALKCFDQAFRLLSNTRDDSALLLVARAMRAKAMILDGQGKAQEAQDCHDPVHLAPQFGEANGRLIATFIEAEKNLEALAAFTNRSGG
jgi:tetratricopeptide (TPR) repeat protein